MIGAYYQTQLLEPINGLGQSDQTKLADEAMAELLDTEPVIYTPWGIQKTDTSFEPAKRDRNYAGFGVSAEQLAAAEKAAFDNPVAFVVVLTPTPLFLAEAEQLFQGTPYELVQGEAVYRQSDPDPVPRAAFFYWGALSDQSHRQGNYQVLAEHAAKVGGALLFVVEMPRTGTERAHPALSVNQALPVQEAEIITATTPATTADVTRPVASKRPTWILYGTAGVLGFAAGYVTLSVLRRKPG